MLTMSEKIQLLRVARDAAWIPEKGDVDAYYDIDKWVKTYKTLRDAILECQKTSEEIS